MNVEALREKLMHPRVPAILMATIGMIGLLDVAAFAHHREQPEVIDLNAWFLENCGPSMCEIDPATTTLVLPTVTSVETPPNPVIVPPAAAPPTAPKPPAPHPATTVAPKPPEAALRVEIPPIRTMSFAEYQKNAELFLSKVPRLDDLAKTFPAAYANAETQKAYIAKLDQEVHPTVANYQAFSIDQSHTKAFVNHPYYNTIINAPILLNHYTVTTNYPDVDHFISSMLSNPKNRKSVAYYIDQDANATTYHLLESDNHKTAQAQGLNNLTQGVEVRASDLTNFTNLQIEHLIYADVRYWRDKGQHITAANTLGHMVADLILCNPFYDPFTGTFHSVNGVSPSLHRQDDPQDFMDVVVRKAIELDQQLGPIS